MIEPILTATFWIDERGRRHALSLFGKRYMLIAVEGMFTYMQRHQWEEAPRQLLIYDVKWMRQRSTETMSDEEEK
jgi:hypothetical protein